MLGVESAYLNISLSISHQLKAYQCTDYTKVCCERTWVCIESLALYWCGKVIGRVVAVCCDDDVHYYIGERLKLEGETENMGVWRRERWVLEGVSRMDGGKCLWLGISKY